MEKTIKIPEGFEAELQGNTVILKHNGREEKKSFRMKVIIIEKSNDEIKVKGINEKRKTNAVVNTTEKSIQNLINGLKNDYEYRLQVVHSHFPVNVQVSGKDVLVSNFIGEKKVRKAKIIGPNTAVQAKGKEIIIKGPNKEHVGQTAANIEAATKVRRKDLRIYQDGAYIVEKKQGEQNG